jgi:ornithine decarboxylase
MSGEDVRLLDLDVVRRNYAEMREAFPFALIYAAVKANSSSGILEVLNEQGSRFEIATIEEMQQCIERGIAPQNIIFSHPAKDALEIAAAHKVGIRHFVSDSAEDVALLAAHAPNSKVIVRMITANEERSQEEIIGFNARFGVYAEQAIALLKQAKASGLQAHGICFHVGTQQEDVHAWDKTIENAAHIYNTLSTENIHLPMLDLGGGLPSRYKADIAPLSQYGKAIGEALKTHFANIPLQEIVIEPGRSLSAMAGVTLGRVINVKPCEDNENQLIITISTGRFSAGLFGVGNQIFFYRNHGGKIQAFENEPVKKAMVYGKACASFDTPMEGTDVYAPATIASGDIVAFNGTGAYSGQMVTEWCSKKAPTTLCFDSRVAIRQTNAI